MHRTGPLVGRQPALNDDGKRLVRSRRKPGRRKNRRFEGWVGRTKRGRRKFSADGPGGEFWGGRRKLGRRTYIQYTPTRPPLSPGAAAPFLEKPILLQQRQRRPGGRRIPVEPGARAAPPAWPTSSPSYESESGRSVRTRRRRRPPASTSTARAPLNPAHAAPGVAGRAWAARERWTHNALRHKAHL